MKKIFSILFIATCLSGNAQQFLNAGLIEYEVRVNVHRQLGDGIWAEQFKSQVPQFSTSYYHLQFDKNKSIYKLDRKDEKTKSPFLNNQTDDNIWFNDYAANTTTQQKFVFDNTYLLSDSLMDIEWKLVPFETREIAGFTCRKAQAVLFDSVYVFAFYTDEILTTGGPMGLQGLPGMIMGVTIPRMYTSWIATKVDLAGLKPNDIKEPTKGKKEKATALKTRAEKAVKDWGEWGQQQIWGIFL